MNRENFIAVRSTLKMLCNSLYVDVDADKITLHDWQKVMQKIVVKVHDLSSEIAQAIGDRNDALKQLQVAQSSSQQQPKTKWMDRTQIDMAWKTMDPLCNALAPESDEISVHDLQYLFLKFVAQVHDLPAVKLQAFAERDVVLQQLREAQAKLISSMSSQQQPEVRAFALEQQAEINKLRQSWQRQQNSLNQLLSKSAVKKSSIPRRTQKPSRRSQSAERWYGVPIVALTNKPAATNNVGKPTGSSGFFECGEPHFVQKCPIRKELLERKIVMLNIELKMARAELSTFEVGETNESTQSPTYLAGNVKRAKETIGAKTSKIQVRKTKKSPTTVTKLPH